jgi:DNA-binding transcriptional regulator YiaG
MRKVKRKRPRAGSEIIGALTGLAQGLERGAAVGTARTVELPDDPGAYDAAAVRATREMLKTSQSLFGRLLGVSTILVRSWESGVRVPSRTARRLLDEIHRDPSRWAALVHKPKSRTSHETHSASTVGVRK